MLYRKAIVFALIVSSGLLFAQENIRETAATTDDHKPAGEPDKYDLSKYDPIRRTDYRFKVSNVNFVRRFASHGNGEFLDVNFELLNSTDEPISLFAYIFAYWETDATFEKNRQWIPYPGWRPNDPEKETFLVHYITSTPADIPESEIWKDKDAAFLAQKRIWERMRESVAATEPIPPFKPPFWRYLSYAMENPTKGLPFQLYGNVGPTFDKVTETNYVPPTPDEVRKKMHTTLKDHKYTMQHSRQRVIFSSHHYSEFRENYKFFNRVAIVLFDKVQAEAFEAQKGRALAEDEKPANPVAFKATYVLSDKMKNY